MRTKSDRGGLFLLIFCLRNNRKDRFSEGLSQSCIHYSCWQHHSFIQQKFVLFSSVAQSCLTLCDPMDCSTPGFSVHYQLPELAQTHWVSDAIQPSHPLTSPSPPASNLSQHQGLFQWVSSFHQVAKVLEFQLQHQSFQWIFRTDFLLDWLVGSPCSPRDFLKSVLQHDSSKASILRRSAFFIIQLSHPNMSTGKAILCHCPSDQCSTLCFYVLDFFRFHI